MVKRLIAEAPGSPTIVEDRIGNAPDVVPIKFSTVEAARQFVDNNKAIKHFEDFWCNMSQTPDERENFKKNVQPLFKIKRAILEVTAIDAATVVVSKAQKKVFVLSGENLKLIAEMITRNNIIWALDISEAVRIRYAVLTE